jgi:hypothetical protein
LLTLLITYLIKQVNETIEWRFTLVRFFQTKWFSNGKNLDGLGSCIMRIEYLQYLCPYAWAHTSRNEGANSKLKSWTYSIEEDENDEFFLENTRWKKIENTRFQKY